MSDVERIKQESRGLRGTLAEELGNEASYFSESVQTLLKFHGSYQQEQRDERRERKKAGLEPAYMFMTRSRVPGGVLTADQYLTHDELAGRFGNGTLRVTTRQTIQLHGVLKGDLAPTIKQLNHALVTTLATCGDVNRNVLTCPAPLPQRIRTQALGFARSISNHLLPKTRAYHEIWIDGVQTESAQPDPDPIYEDRYLPRKFKTAIAFPEDNCTDVFSNDLGLLVVHNDDNLVGFNVLVGKGFGQTHGKEETYPRLASTLGFVAPEGLLDVATAVITAQRDFGNRENRKRARLKYLIDERGLEWFRAEVEQRLGERLAPARELKVTGAHDHLGWNEQGQGVWFFGLFIENGRIRDTDSNQTRSALRSIVSRFKPGVHLTPQQNLLLTGLSDRQRFEVERILRDHGIPDISRVTSVRRSSMACPALPTCPLALAESERALPGVIDELEIELELLGLSDVPFTVRMTGCPNGCARPYTADLAFVGRSLDKYVIYVGGNLEGTRLNSEYADLVPRGKLVSTVRPLLERFAFERKADERFGDFCDRVGVTRSETA